MYNQMIAAQKFRFIRTAYKLTQRELSLIIPSISGVTFNYWEHGERIPTIEKLTSWSLTFGISIDWIAGVASEPYTEDSVFAAEQCYYQSFRANFKKRADVTIPYFDEHKEFQKPKLDYVYNDDRPKNYSLAVRANIIVLLSRLDIPRVPPKNSFYHDALFNLISRQEKQPLFDLSIFKNDLP
jgi:transcriptional regulator with XRE-family HTH domain